MASITAVPPPQQQQYQQQSPGESGFHSSQQATYQQQQQTFASSNIEQPHNQPGVGSDNVQSFQPYLSPEPDSPTYPVEANPTPYAYDAYAGQNATEDSTFTSFSTPESSLGQKTKSINAKYQLFLDKITPHWKARWAFSLTALFVFMARVILSQGWYVVCYALAIYYLNLFIGFITPKFDPGSNSGDEEDGPMLPTHASDEFKPFIRRLPEFKFWLSATKATLLSLFLTLFEIFDIPVFWPILLLYFIILTACTMREQIKHMIKWKYVPWDAGKKKYDSKGPNFSPTTV